MNYFDLSSYNYHEKMGVPLIIGHEMAPGKQCSFYLMTALSLFTKTISVTFLDVLQIVSAQGCVSKVHNRRGKIPFLVSLTFSIYNTQNYFSY